MPNTMNTLPTSDTANYADPTNTTVKPAWKTLEGIISIVVVIVGALLATGLFNPNDPKYGWLVQLAGALIAAWKGQSLDSSRASIKVGQQQAATSAIVGIAQANAQVTSTTPGMTVTQVLND